MMPFTNKLIPALLGLLILIVAIPLIIFLILTQQNLRQKEPISGNVASWPVISRNVPAYASSTSSPASNADDNSYDTIWQTRDTPAWLVYDLSSVPASRRGKVLVVWYSESHNYDFTIVGDFSYNFPQNYTIDVNPGAGGGKPPGAGWVTLLTVTGNHYHSRQHVIDMAGSNWLRINITAVNGAPDKDGASINMDIYDTDYGTSDDWIFFGDSITAGAMGHTTVDGVKTFAQLINKQAPNNFPIQEAGGIGSFTSADGAKYINKWLQLFPGVYVVLSYGTNDASRCTDADSFYENYVTMVQTVLNQGKIPIVPHIPWGRNANIQKCAPALNCKIDDLYRAFPQIIKGPDLWTFFQKHQDLISDDDIHPTQMGFGAYRQQWANMMLAVVYGKKDASR